MEQALRYNEGKPQWSLVDFKSIIPMVEVLEYGCKKYDRDNWKKGLPTREICESMIRHCMKLLEGQYLDDESGLPHVGHIMCNAMFLEHVVINKPHFDNLFGLGEILNETPSTNTQVQQPTRSSNILSSESEAFGGLGGEISAI